MPDAIIEKDGRRWSRYEPLARYVIKFTVPQNRDPYVLFLEEKVKRLDAKVAEVESVLKSNGIEVNWTLDIVSHEDVTDFIMTAFSDGAPW